MSGAGNPLIEGTEISLYPGDGFVRLGCVKVYQNGESLRVDIGKKQMAYYNGADTNTGMKKAVANVTIQQGYIAVTETVWSMDVQPFQWVYYHDFLSGEYLGKEKKYAEKGEKVIERYDENSILKSTEREPVS